MTNKRYSKFQSEITGLFCIADENHKETFGGMDNEYNCMRIVNILNQKEERIKKLEKENEILKDTIDGLSGMMAHMEDLGDVE